MRIQPTQRIQAAIQTGTCSLHPPRSHSRWARLCCGVLHSESIQSFFQVGIDGRYAPEKIAALASWQCTIVTQLAWLVLAPLPCILVPLALELVSLNEPCRGWQANLRFYARCVIYMLLVGCCTQINMREIVPKLRHSVPTFRLICIWLSIALIFAGTLLVCAATTEIFPFPFSSIVPLPIFAVMGLLVVSPVCRCLWPPVPMEAHDGHLQWQNGHALISLLIGVYCGYASAFHQAGDVAQQVFPLLLHLIKQWAKRQVWRYSCINSQHHAFAADNVVFGAYFFHSFFSVMCLRTSRTTLAYAITMVLMLAQDVFTMGGIWHQARQCMVLRREKQQRAHMSSLVIALPPGQATRVGPNGPSASSHAALPNSAHIEGEDDARFLHWREIVLLHLYVDIFVPMLYLLYLAVMVRLPNASYSALLVDMTPDEMSTTNMRIFSWITLKLGMLAFLLWTLWVYQRSSGIRQLAFAVATRWRSMQSRLLLNTLPILMFTLYHMGNDLTFRFAWIGHSCRV